MINTKTYISKANTIIKDSCANAGLNALIELQYGKDISRGIIYFDHNKVKQMVEDKTYPDINKLHHTLHMVNTGSAVPARTNCIEVKSYDMNSKKQRAQSFDLIFFLIPDDWDNGTGASYHDDIYAKNRVGFSMRGSNWYQFRNHFRWDNEGVYTTDQLSQQMDLFTSKNGNLSNVIVAYQHFDYGNEDINLDITCIFNKFLTGEIENHGFGIAFAPSYEETNTHFTQSVCFFSPNTHTFFEPYIETTYDETIEDDRTNFYLDKDNKLYFYASVGGRYTNLDELPVCTINSQEYAVKQATRGIYYIDINLSSIEHDSDVMYYDIWSNIKYNGKHLKDVELAFTTKSEDGYFIMGLPTDDNKDETKFIPSLYGIQQSEKLQQRDTRKINISCKVPYTSNEQYCVDGMEYRLYVHEGENEIDVIKWSKVERGYNENYFLLNIAELIPSRYHIDIKINYNTEVIYHHNLLTFDVVNDLTEDHK